MDTRNLDECCTITDAVSSRKDGSTRKTTHLEYIEHEQPGWILRQHKHSRVEMTVPHANNTTTTKNNTGTNTTNTTIK